ncbi:tetratricopeptide repeat protein [Burkholderia ubonensis]|uniref:tetratricopeptide repeat protein n=1 Tax=Burkholderia ubonensis TaxID=101571 RepID=UPI000B2D55BC|nr:tetratricopeptide repeat protein [Burkholderia ubonensis]
MQPIDRLVALLTAHASRDVAKVITLWAILGSTLMLELWLLWTWTTPIHFSSKPGFTVYTASAVLLPLLSTACYFRLPTGRRRIDVRYIVRPVQCVRVPSEYNPQAITLALNRELGYWRGVAKARPAQSLPPAASVNVAHLSLPVEWLWSTCRRTLTGLSDVTIEATLIDFSKPHRLVAWCSGSGFPAESNIDPTSENWLNESVLSVVNKLIEEIDPACRAQICWWRQEYDKAIRLLRQQPPTPSRDLDIARLYFYGNQDDLALEQLQVVETGYKWLSRKRRDEIHQLRAEIYEKVGEYAKAEEALQELIHRAISRTGKDCIWARELKTMLGGCHLDAGAFEEALLCYEQVEALALAHLRRITGSPTAADLPTCLRRGLVRPSVELDNLLLEICNLFAARATCLRLQGQDPYPEYVRELDVLLARRSSPRDSPWQLDMRCAQIFKYAAYATLSRRELEDATQLFQKALQLYRDAIQRSADDPYGRFDFQVQTNLAWCECGKFQCQRFILALEVWPELHNLNEEYFRIVADLVDALPVEEQERFLRMWTLVGLQDVDNEERDEALVKAAAIVTRRLLDSWEPGALAILRHRLTQLSGSPSQSPSKDLVDRIFDQCLIADESNGRELERRRNLLEGTIGLLNLIQEERGDGDLDRLAEKFRQQYEEKEIYDQCIQKIEVLKSSPNHQAEHAYCLACINAILCDRIEDGSPYVDLINLETVAENLERAIDCSQSETTRSGYIGRARTDPDFDHIRLHPRVRRLLDVG